MGFNPNSLPALTALATLIAAVVGGLFALLVATINSWTTRLVARDNAHREFRQERVQALLSRTRAVCERLSRIRAEELTLPAEMTTQSEALREQMVQFVWQSDDDFINDREITRTLKLIDDAQFFFVVATDRELPAGERRSATFYFCDVMTLACEAVQLQAESFVYGISRRSARRQETRAIRKLQQAKEEMKRIRESRRTAEIAAVTRELTHAPASGLVFGGGGDPSLPGQTDPLPASEEP